jgi:LAO/AO transport system kinase
MPADSTTPDWAPAGGGPEFATRVVAGVPAPAIPAVSALPRPTGPSDLAGAIRSGDRVALARGITLVESRAAAHRAAADELLNALMPAAGKAWRVGITGVPGVGKSTFIDALGIRLCAAGRKVAVLSVDPSSPVSHGSILGDKTRMERLARHPAAFIRPSPSGGEIGGVARKTRETITLCEAAGFDTVLVETVGVGQSEVLVREMVDCFLLLMIAGAGDELQGIKKGIVEMADIVAVNKADGDNRTRAEAARLEFERALHYFTVSDGDWQPPVLACSALEPDGSARVWAEVERFMAHGVRTGQFLERRRSQSLSWLSALLEQGLREAFASNPEVATLKRALELEVAAGNASPPTAARVLLEAAGLRPGPGPGRKEPSP